MVYNFPCWCCGGSWSRRMGPQALCLQESAAPLSCGPNASDLWLRPAIWPWEKRLHVMVCPQKMLNTQPQILLPSVLFACVCVLVDGGEDDFNYVKHFELQFHGFKALCQ